MSDEAGADVKAITAIMAALKPLDGETRNHVLDYVLKRLGMVSPKEQRSNVEPGIEPSTRSEVIEPALSLRANAPRDRTGQDIRSFAAEKHPQSGNEKVAVVAYYLAHVAPEEDRKDYLTADDIKTFFIQAGFELPTGPARMTLINAKNAGYFNAGDRGQYKLNAVGYNLVAHKLPGGESSGGGRKSVSRKALKKNPGFRKKTRK